MAGVTLDAFEAARRKRWLAHDVLWHMVHDNLPLLKTVCLDELATARQADR
jgi:hypothetical protein